MSSTAQSFEFQAETKQLLDLMIHSLYTSKEIFLRELISNASDALDHLRFESLSRPELIEGDEKLEIRLDADPKARTLTISDNGIGMSRDEVISNIGTIARSGTRELREKIRSAPSQDAVTQLIGQFGVGFYSSFMAADKVTLITRRAGEQSATKWESSGDGVYTLDEAESAHRGTSITLHLKPVDSEQGIEDYTDKWILSRIIRKYSDFVSYPIIFRDEREEKEPSDASKPGQESKTTIVVEDQVLNSMKPIWARSQSEVTEEEYKEFYKHISHEWEPPLKTLHLKAEGRFEYQALLFIPGKASYDLYYHGFKGGLRLYAKRVMIMEQCEELLPRYLRFMKGVIDSADLPLNISRQMLQQDSHITQIRKWLTRKVLDVLSDMRQNDTEKYLEFWEQFGKAFKESVSSDYENKDRLMPLLLFQSSADPAKLTTLQEYVGRMKEGQEEIYYLTGESRRLIESSPHLEAFKVRDYEVLYLVDAVDELLVQSVTEFDGKRLKSIGKGRIAFDKDEQNELKQQEETYGPLLEYLQKGLDEHIKQVRLSNRLTTSPVCLVVEEHDYSPQLERLLQKGKGGGPKQRRVLELNPSHALVARLRERFQANAEDPGLIKYANLLLGYALLAEGSELPDPVGFNQVLVEVLAQTL